MTGGKASTTSALLFELFQARSSVVEHYLDTVGVVGSIPIAPTADPFSSLIPLPFANQGARLGTVEKYPHLLRKYRATTGAALDGRVVRSALRYSSTR